MRLREETLTLEVQRTHSLERTQGNNTLEKSRKNRKG